MLRVVDNKSYGQCLSLSCPDILRFPRSSVTIVWIVELRQRTVSRTGVDTNSNTMNLQATKNRLVCGQNFANHQAPPRPENMESQMPLYIRHAVYLNNVGCTLLKRSAFGDAANTFSDALFLARPETATDPSLTERLQQANQRLAFPSICSCVQCGGGPASTKAPFLTLDDYRRVDMDDLFVQPALGNLAIHPVRIEEKDLVVNNPDLYLGIMMFNLGLAYAGLSKCSNNSVVLLRQHFRAGAIRMFQLADTTIHSTLTYLKKIETCDQWDQLKLCACVNMAVLHSLLQLLADYKSCASSGGVLHLYVIVDACDQVYQRMLSLRASLCELEQKFFGDVYPSFEALRMEIGAAAA